MVEPRRDFWVRETGMGQQAAQLHERLMMMLLMMIMMMICYIGRVLDVQQVHTVLSSLV